MAGAGRHRVDVDGASLHYMSAGDSGSPVLLVHGFPEMRWASHDVIPLLTTGAPGARCGPARVRDSDPGAVAVTVEGFGAELDAAPTGC